MAKRMGWIAVLVLVFLAAFAMNCGVMAEGDSGIRVSVPYQYIVPQNPGENSGLTFSIQIPEEITDDQIQLQSVMARCKCIYKKARGVKYEKKAADHSYAGWFTGWDQRRCFGDRW